MAISTPNPVIQSPIKQLSLAQPPETISYEQECKDIGKYRLFFVAAMSLVVQYILMMTYSLLTFNFSYLNPVTWFWDFPWVILSPLSVANLIHVVPTLNKLLNEKSYCPTRISKYMQSFIHESLLFGLNFFYGLFTARLFMRCLSQDYKYPTDESKELNESYSFLLLTGVFMRYYFYYMEEKSDGLNFPVIHQSKIQQIRRELIVTVKSSLLKALMPTIHFIGFYVIFGSSFSYFLRSVFFLKDTERSGFINNFRTLYDVKVVIYAWILSAMIFAHIRLFNKLIDIFATQPKEFSITRGLTITKVLEIEKIQITQHLAAQDLFLLADSANSTRRKEFYALSIPGKI